MSTERLATVKTQIRSAVTAAVHDPFGARLVLLEYGRLAEFPDISVGPMQLKGGEDGWTRAINLAQPLWLGVAWQKIELLEEGLQREHDKIEAIKANTHKHAQMKGATVPVIQWTDSAAGLEVGSYPVEITEISQEDGQYGAQLRFQFVVVDDDNDLTDAQIRGWCSEKWGEKTKLYKWAKNILGRKCPLPNQPIDTDRLLHKRCDIVVGPKKKSDGSMSSGIEDVFPFRTLSAKRDDDETADDNSDLFTSQLPKK